jgi:hypothetical protein
MERRVRVRLDSTLYPSAAVAEAIAAFTAMATIEPQRGNPESLDITITSDEERCLDEFLNYALAASLELHLAHS